MPIPVELNIAIRNRVRRPFVLPGPAPVILTADLATDTTPEQLQVLRAARAVPSAQQEIERAARAEEAARRLAIQPPAAGHVLSNLGFSFIPGTSLFGAALGPIGFPYTITEILFSSGSSSAAGTIETQVVGLLVSTNNSLTQNAILSDLSINLDSFIPQDGIHVSYVQLLGQHPLFVTYHPNYDVQIAPTFLKVLTTIAGGAATPNFSVVINESPPILIPGARFTPPTGRINLNLNTQPPPPRTARAPVPRAAVISITQGGRILSERTIAWESLQPELRADWFNRQVGGTPDPNIRWIP